MASSSDSDYDDYTEEEEEDEDEDDETEDSEDDDEEVEEEDDDDSEYSEEEDEDEEDEDEDEEEGVAEEEEGEEIGSDSDEDEDEQVPALEHGGGKADPDEILVGPDAPPSEISPIPEDQQQSLSIQADTEGPQMKDLDSGLEGGIPDSSLSTDVAKLKLDHPSSSS